MSAMEAIAIASPTKPSASSQPGRGAGSCPRSSRTALTPLDRKGKPSRSLHVNGNPTPENAPRRWAILPAVPFISFEGVEGCGKSTQLRLLGDRLRSGGRDVRATREPGGTPLGERLRALLLESSHAPLDPIAEWLLFEADRRQHLAEVVRPALAAGAWVLCDRFSDSTEAYQAGGRGLDAEMIAGLD